MAGLMGFVSPIEAFSGKKKPYPGETGLELLSYPASRISPTDESELVEFLKQSSGSIRTVGSGHSLVHWSLRTEI